MVVLGQLRSAEVMSSFCISAFLNRVIGSFSIIRFRVILTGIVLCSFVSVFFRLLVLEHTLLD